MKIVLIISKTIVLINNSSYCHSKHPAEEMLKQKCFEIIRKIVHYLIKTGSDKFLRFYLVFFEKRIFVQAEFFNCKRYKEILCVQEE